MRTDARDARGFTMVEMLVAIACFVILATGVLVVRGYSRSSKASATAQTFLTLKAAARTWSDRERRGQGYGGAPDAATVINSADLFANKLIPTNPVTAAFDSDADGNLDPIGIDAIAAPAPMPPDPQWLRLSVCTPAATMIAEDMQSMLETTGAVDIIPDNCGGACAGCRTFIFATD